MRMRLRVDKMERAGSEHLRVHTCCVHEGTNPDRVDAVGGVELEVLTGTPDAKRLFEALQSGETMFWQFIDPTEARPVDDRDELWARWEAVTKALGYDSPHGATLDTEHGALAVIGRLQAMAIQAREQTP